MKLDNRVAGNEPFCSAKRIMYTLAKRFYVNIPPLFKVILGCSVAYRMPTDRCEKRSTTAGLWCTAVSYFTCLVVDHVR